jgi:tetratricopeptide (TPR) repeat protein
VNGTPSSRSCPAPSVLAEFVDGTLDSELRGEVERHVADCPECPIVVGETVRFLNERDEEGEPTAAHGRPWWWLAAAAALAALCFPALLWYNAERDPLREVKQITARSATRPVEGRLANFDYAPFGQGRSDRRVSSDLALQAAAERLSERGGTDAGTLHARGVALLVTSHAAEAVQLLSAATRSDPRNADAWNDLAAAQIALANVTDKTRLAEAIAAADRAIALAPGSASPSFNRAIAVQALGRRGEALLYYRRVVELEPRSRWSAEAKSRISQIEE